MERTEIYIKLRRLEGMREGAGQTHGSNNTPGCKEGKTSSSAAGGTTDSSQFLLQTRKTTNCLGKNGGEVQEKAQ